MFIIKRGDRYGVRLLDPQSSARTNFKGLSYFPLQSAYRVDAKFVRDDTPKKVPVPNVLGQTVEMESPGYVTSHCRATSCASSRCTKPRSTKICSSSSVT